jgi:ankyrin repeat protein/tetratricopeptide (TPR) repeat protein
MASLATTNQWLDEKIAQADACRMLGNDHFRQGDMSSAINQYNVALTIIGTARTSAEAVPLEKWKNVHVAGWVHEHFGADCATKFVDAGITGTDLTSINVETMENFRQKVPSANFSSELLLERLNVQNSINHLKVTEAMNRQEAKILSNRSLSKGKIQDHTGAAEDATLAVQLFPEWGKAHYRLGSALLKLSNLNPSDANMIDKARTAFADGAKVEVSEHCSENDIIALQQKAKICTQKLERYLKGLQMQMKELEARSSNGGEKVFESEYSRSAPIPPPSGRNDLSILSCGLKDDVETLKKKLDSGSSPNSSNQMKQTALHVAAIWGALKVGRLLISRGANVNAKNNMSGGTPLMMAAQRGRVEFAKLLLESGANPTQQDDRGMFAYEYARNGELKEMLGGPSSKLLDAVRAGDKEKVEEISTKHPELVAAPDSDGNTPLSLALRGENYDISMYFVQHPAAVSFVNEHDSEGETPLHLACRWEDEKKGLELMFGLLKAGAEINRVSLRMDEYHGGNYEVMNSTTGKMDVVSALHRTPLFEAVESGNAEIVKCMLEFNCKVNERDGDGCTALYVAIDEDEEEIAEMLLKSGADPNLGNMDIGEDNTLLAWTSSRRKFCYVDMLLKSGANPNLPGKSGLYPLHMAARVGGNKCIEVLLKYGADPLKVDPSGCTPQMIAEKNERSIKAGCVDLLLRAKEEKK